MNRHIVNVSIFLMFLGVCAATLNNRFTSDANESQQTQASTITELRNSNAPIETQAISQLVFSHPESAVPDEYIQHLPTSLLNTPLPQRLDINEDGSLRINKKILHLFEFYLSAIGEEPLERIIARINHNLTEQLTAQALTEALDILDGYLQFRNAITAIKQEHNQMASDDYASFEHIIISRNELIATRWRFLSEEVIAAFFEQEDQYEHYMFSLVEIRRNHNLSDEQKSDAISALNTQSPDWLIKQQSTANKLNVYRQKYYDMVQQGASDNELNMLREQEFNAQAADRLSALDTKREQWQQRINEYRIELATLVSIEPDNQAQQELIKALRNQHFNAQEIRRIRALDSRDLASY